MCKTEVKTYYIDKVYFWQTLTQNSELLQFFIDHAETKLVWQNRKLTEQMEILSHQFKISQLRQS